MAKFETTMQLPITLNKDGFDQTINDRIKKVIATRFNVPVGSIHLGEITDARGEDIAFPLKFNAAVSMTVDWDLGFED